MRKENGRVHRIFTLAILIAALIYFSPALVHFFSFVITPF